MEGKEGQTKKSSCKSDKKGVKEKTEAKKRGRLKFKRGNEMGNGSMEE